MHLHQYIKCVYLVLAFFAASSAIVHDVIARNFSVCEVEPGKIVHPEVQYLSNEDLQRWAGKNETLQLENIQLVHPLAGNIGYRIPNAFVGTVLIAYSHHYSLELSVEDIWVAIAQGVSIHLNENAEKYRQLFVSHEGKKKLIVSVDDLLISTDERASKVNLSIPVIHWPKAVHRMGDLIKANIKVDLATVITQPFSQTTNVQQAVFDACLMDTVKSYFDYDFSILCGIPQVTLLGSPDDFQSIIDRLNQLEIFFPDLHWWLNPLLLHVQRLKDSAQGNPDIAWWRRILYEGSIGCGDMFLTGWIVDFVPSDYFHVRYITNHSGGYRQTGRSEKDGTHRVDVSDFNEAVTQTDFILDNNGVDIKMKLIAGFLDISISPSRSRRRRDFKRQLIDNKSHDTGTFIE
ncbi:unnamed protein product [Rotaria sp. Silwood2]|nr:unnamed protein product [Rotaria sp. Silwood2]